GGGRAQRIDPAQPLALRKQVALLVLGRPERLDLLDLEAEQVEVAVAVARLLAQGLELAAQLAHARVDRRKLIPRGELVPAAEAVEELQLGGGHRQAAVLVLAEEGDEPAAELAQVGRRRAPALHEGP